MIELKVDDIEVKYGRRYTMVILRINSILPAEIAEKLVSALRPWRCLLKIWRERRSVSANSYAWVLLDRLAAVLHIGKNELYRRAVKEIGGNTHTFVVQKEAVGVLVKAWESQGLGWQAEVLPSDRPGYVDLLLYDGSSSYDTEQMSRLIDYIVQDCQAVGIETKTPDELAALLGLWAGDGLG